jgi:hypothetical protein
LGNISCWHFIIKWLFVNYRFALEEKFKMKIINAEQVLAVSGGDGGCSFPTFCVIMAGCMGVMASIFNGPEKYDSYAQLYARCALSAVAGAGVALVVYSISDALFDSFS